MDSLNAGEYGFLLLTSHLGDPERKPLTVAQFRTLIDRSENMKRSEISRDVDVYDFVSIGYSPKAAKHIVDLLHDEVLLQYYLVRARKADCVPVTRATPEYPLIVRKRLGLDAPGCLWAKGDLAILDAPAVALVGSRELEEPNREFAEEVGRQAALQGYTLVSGNARGADKTAQNACLRAGGRVVSIVADSLMSHKARENVLYLSEDSFDAEFSAQRALSRNRVIHAMGIKAFAAQCSYQRGGTWDGTVKNLRFGWSTVFCFDDGSPAVRLLEQMGANLIDSAALRNISALVGNSPSLFDA